MPRSLLAALAAGLSLAFALSPFFGEEFGGFDPNQFPVAQDNPPVQPAGYAFSIWGVIYLWLIAGMGWGFWKRREDPAWHSMRRPLALSLAVGTIWLQVANASPIWATVLIWVMLLTALYALFHSPRKDNTWASLPVGLFAGWLSAASCVSLGLLAAGYGLTDQGTAALGAIFLALVLASAVQNQLRRAPSYGMAVIWALVAVVVQNISLTGNTTVAALAAGGAVALAWPTFKAARKS